MKGLPKTFDSSFLVGRTVDQVSFAVNNVSLNFDAGLILTVEGSFEHRVGLGDSGPEVRHPPVLESKLMQLAGHQVSKATVEDDGGLRLLFEDGQSFRCVRDQGPYECFQIRLSDGEEIVA